MIAASELGEYVAAAFATYEDMREQRDEAIQQRDVARDWTVQLEQENAKLRSDVNKVVVALQITGSPFSNDVAADLCEILDGKW